MDKLISRGKDSTPSVTVHRIRDTLEKAGLPAEHEMIETGLADCFCSRVSLSGPLKSIIGTNGKGTTEEFCLASGYAELMERIQNIIFMYTNHFFDDTQNGQLVKLIPNAVFKTWNELFAEDKYINALVSRCEDSMINIPLWLRRKTAEEQFRATFSDMHDEIPCIPYYHVNSGRYAAFPECVARYFIMSNGMAAGNTLEEALVQGYSELFERLAQSEIMQNKLTPPELPGEVLIRYPHIKKMIANIEKSGPYKVKMFDASLGKNYPVVFGVIVNTKTQTFGVRFGAHPNMGIALERVITESLQGKNLEQFTRFSDIIFSEVSEDNYKNVFNNMKTGHGFYPASIFGPVPSYAFSEWEWDGNGENKELAYKMSGHFQNLGFDIYIRDVSFLGLPSVCITIPGISEVCPPTFLYLKELKLRFSVMHNMLHIDKLDAAKAKQIILYCKVVRGDVLQNTVNSLYGLPLYQKFHGRIGELDFLIAACCYYLGDIQEAHQYMHSCRSALPEAEKDYAYIHLAEKLLLGRLNGYPPELIEGYLKSVSDAETYLRVMEDFKDPQQILMVLYPHFRDFEAVRTDSAVSSYGELCAFYQKIYTALYNNDVSQLNLHNLFSAYQQRGVF